MNQVEVTCSVHLAAWDGYGPPEVAAQVGTGAYYTGVEYSARAGTEVHRSHVRKRDCTSLAQAGLCTGLCRPTPSFPHFPAKNVAYNCYSNVAISSKEGLDPILGCNQEDQVQNSPAPQDSSMSLCVAPILSISSISIVIRYLRADNWPS